MTTNLPALFPMSDLEKMAAQMVNSRLFGIDNIAQAVTLMLVAQAQGLHPATAARDYHIIKGRPSMKADAMLANFQQSGGVVEWQEYTDTKVSGTFKHPQSPKPVLIEWTFDMAKRIGLTGKDNWRNYPRAMLRARVISEGVRTCYPAIATGVYTPEEVQDFAPEKDITPTAGYLQSLPAKRQEVIIETGALVREHMDNDRPMDAYGLVEGSGFDAEETIALWSLLPSHHRSALKRITDAERAAERGTITEAQKRRLEAIIGEKKMDRDAIKAYCAKEFQVEHFTDLSREQYDSLCLWLSTNTPKAEGVTGATAVGGGAPSAAPSNGDYVTPDQHLDLEDELRKHKRTADQLIAAMKAAGVTVPSLAKMPASVYERAMKWATR